MFSEVTLEGNTTKIVDWSHMLKTVKCILYETQFNSQERRTADFIQEMQYLSYHSISIWHTTHATYADSIESTACAAHYQKTA